MNQHTGRTVIASIVFVDIVDYSKASGAQQFAMKSVLNGTIHEALKDIAESERIVLDTGDGAALCFIGDPEDALFVASAIRDAIIRHEGDGRHSLRIGINLGPVKFVTDLNGQTNVVGDGINVAERVMSFAGEDELLVSRSYYEVVSRLSDGNERFFRYLGEKKDKHVREHQVYAFGGAAGDPGTGGAEPEGDTGQPAVRRSRGDGGAVPDSDACDAISRRLGDRIGPLARVIVGRAAHNAANAREFFETVSTAIPDAADRADFLADMAEYTSASESQEAAPVEPAKPGVASGSLAEADIVEAERVLAQIIGPIARVMVRKVAETASGRADLYDRIAASINSPVDRERFRAAAGKKVG